MRAERAFAGRAWRAGGGARAAAASSRKNNGCKGSVRAAPAAACPLGGGADARSLCPPSGAWCLVPRGQCFRDEWPCSQQR